MPGVTSIPEIKKENQDQKAPLYNVVLLDDDQHTYEYVVEMIEKLFACSEADAYAREVMLRLEDQLMRAATTVRKGIDALPTEGGSRRKRRERE